MTELGQAIFQHTLAAITIQINAQNHASHELYELAVKSLADMSDVLAKVLLDEITDAVLNTEERT